MHVTYGGLGKRDAEWKILTHIIETVAKSSENYVILSCVHPYAVCLCLSWNSSKESNRSNETPASEEK